MAKVYPKSWFWMHAFNWPEQTLKIYMQYTTYFSCNNDLWSPVLAKLLGDVFLSFLPNLSLEERHLRTVTSAKGSQNSECYLLAFDWLEQTHFLNFVSNFSLEGGDWVKCLWQHHGHISKMGNFKCTFLFNICTISILTCYGIGLDLHNICMVLLMFAQGNIKFGVTKPIFLDSASPRGEGLVHAWAWFVTIV